MSSLTQANWFALIGVFAVTVLIHALLTLALSWAKERWGARSSLKGCSPWSESRRAGQRPDRCRTRRWCRSRGQWSRRPSISIQPRDPRREDRTPACRQDRRCRATAKVVRGRHRPAEVPVGVKRRHDGGRAFERRASRFVEPERPVVRLVRPAVVDGSQVVHHVATADTRMPASRSGASLRPSSRCCSKFLKALRESCRLQRIHQALL